MVHQAALAQMILCQHLYHLDVWRLASAASNPVHEAPPEEGAVSVRQLETSKAHRHVVHVSAKGDSSIACSAISRSGRHVAYSDASTLRVVRIDFDAEGEVCVDVSVHFNLRSRV